MDSSSSATPGSALETESGRPIDEQDSTSVKGANVNVEDEILMRMRRDTMYELRKLKHQHKPVSTFEGSQLLEKHIHVFSANSASASPQPAGAEAEATGSSVPNRLGDAAVTKPRAPMPDSIRLEISGLIERRLVSEVLQTPEVVHGIERAVQEGAERRNRSSRGSRRPRSQQTPQAAAPAAAHAARGHVHARPQPRPRVAARGRPRAPPRAPSRDQRGNTPEGNQSTILEQVRSSPALNSLDPEARDRVVAEIGDLVQQQLVSTALRGEFRGILELHIQERADRVAQGVGVDQLMENLHRRSEHSHAASASHVHSSIPSDSNSVEDLKQEMQDMRVQLLEMKQLMRLSFDLQLDIQRSIRQEIAAAVSAQCQPLTAPVSCAPTGGSQVSVHIVQSGHCTICSEASIDSVIYRCGHMCVCMACGMELKAQGLKCPICRAPITDLIRAYASMC